MLPIALQRYEKKWRARHKRRSFFSRTGSAGNTPCRVDQLSVPRGASQHGVLTIAARCVFRRGLFPYPSSNAVER